eukprot:48063-Pleurochrysis_carterae.AAC.1
MGTRTVREYNARIRLQVKSYIAKYNLEDELSNAVNLAIKQNSTDPYLVISEYMKSLSTTVIALGPICHTMPQWQG